MFHQHLPLRNSIDQRQHGATEVFRERRPRGHECGEFGVGNGGRYIRWYIRAER